MSIQLPAVVVHFAEGSSSPDFYSFGDGVRLFIVDDNAKNDRVYEILTRDPMEMLSALIPDGSVIGSQEDERHAAIEHSVKCLMTGKPRLSVVQKGEPA